MLPEFSQLPEWVGWIAQDADGTWWAYEHEPNMSDAGWYENEVGRSVRLLDDVPNPAWREELHNLKDIINKLQ